MAKAKFMNGEFSAKFKGKRKFVAEQMEAIKDYAARDDMQINICPVIQERPSGKKNTEEQITPTNFISGNLEQQRQVSEETKSIFRRKQITLF